MDSGSEGPGLGHLQAYGLLIVYCLVYVLPLYASSTTRPSPTRSRDSPEAIRARVRAVSLSTSACCTGTLLILCRSAAAIRSSSGSLSEPATARYLLQSPSHLMGIWPVGFNEIVKSLLLTSLLFAGPLFECLVLDGAWRYIWRLNSLKQVWYDHPTWRNIIVGPVTEECLFRSATVPLLLLAGSNLSSIVFRSPLVFGLAHLHHFYEFRITHPHSTLTAGIVRSLLQFSYTSVFGAYATFLFLRTGSLLAVIVVHAFCNCVGLPRLWGSVEPYWTLSRDSRASNSLTKWTALYYMLLLGGCVSWYANLYYLTQSSLALAAL
ncbi:hypothetical protein CDD83_2443 [Cordyceps sp. RAO-2017]|nr:hypothetical protein CDD83_2443 [Cordyceps sp. RAO-2017]